MKKKRNEKLQEITARWRKSLRMVGIRCFTDDGMKQNLTVWKSLLLRFFFFYSFFSHSDYRLLLCSYSSFFFCCCCCLLLLFYRDSFVSRSFKLFFFFWFFSFFLVILIHNILELLCAVAYACAMRSIFVYLERVSVFIIRCLKWIERV